MSNIPANNRPDPVPDHQLQIDVHCHLDDEPEPSGAGGQSRLPALSTEDTDRLGEAAIAAALQRGFHQGSIEIAVVDDPRIHQLNRQFLDHDWETDVISFPYACQGGRVEGELIVSWETAVRRAAQTGWPAATELALYVIHGTLHLTGMDDVDQAGRREMRRAEQAVIAQLKLAGADRYDVDREPDGENSRGENSRDENSQGEDARRQSERSA